jgi:3-hydroxymyristoyl/3-hydroxydecanoyl-(acyl carrier protein) dehydratase
MPGTLMFEGCLQAMAFYMMASGLTLGRDGWRFEPAPDSTYELRCRGQVTPRSQLLVYELFVHELVENPVPLLVADLLCTVDGLKAFHCRRMCLRLTPGHPMDERPAIEAPSARETGVASVNGVALDYASLLACAWGSPVDAFGPPFAKFETGRLPRLPGPPYHFVSRITRIDGEFGVERAGSTVLAEFDVDPSAWFFECSGGVMPLAVLMEIGLQPCGWLACYSGIPLRAEEDVYFRNLNGSATVHGAVEMLRGRIRTRSKLTNVARSAGITLTTFDVQCEWNGRTVLDMQTTFGFFSSGDLARQTGLAPVAGADAGQIEDVLIDLKSAPGRYCAGPLRMPSGNLLMLDRITGLGGGPNGGWVRAEKDVRPSEWFFKAHFYQDPVQPGSLGLDALVQALEFYAIHHGVAEHIGSPRFIIESPLVWKYRGQVLPTNRRIVVEVRVTGVERTSESTSLRAEGWLLVDGVRIYHFSNFGLKVVSGDRR